MSDTVPALDTAELAAVLHRARQGRSAVPTLTSRHPDVTLADAYAVQAAGIDLRLADGETLVGGKLGFTSAAMRRAMGVDSPNYGWLTDEMVLTDQHVDLDRFIHPKVEPEIAFRLAADVEAWTSVGDVLAATDAVAPCLEIVDSRYVDFRFRPLDNVADNSSAGAFVLGDWTELDADPFDLSTEECLVTVDGREHGRATGAAAHGHPAEAVAWMANHCGRPLPAGSIVISGGLTAPVDLTPERVVTACFDRLGAVTLRTTTD